MEPSPTNLRALFPHHSSAPTVEGAISARAHKPSAHLYADGRTRQRTPAPSGPCRSTPPWAGPTGNRLSRHRELGPAHAPRLGERGGGQLTALRVYVHGRVCTDGHSPGRGGRPGALPPAATARAGPLPRETGPLAITASPPRGGAPGTTRRPRHLSTPLGGQRKSTPGRSPPPPPCWPAPPPPARVLGASRTAWWESGGSERSRGRKVGRSGENGGLLPGWTILKRPRRLDPSPSSCQLNGSTGKRPDRPAAAARAGPRRWRRRCPPAVRAPRGALSSPRAAVAAPNPKLLARATVQRTAPTLWCGPRGAGAVSRARREAS